MEKENNNIIMPLLQPEDIEVKFQQVMKTGAIAVLYKSARTDRKYLNKVYGPMNWTNKFEVVKDNLFCGIGVRDTSSGEFVWKWDCGTESRADDKGNERKGEASDAFKRAAFQWGIGEELYTSPTIILKIATKQEGNKWVAENKYAEYVVTDIKYNEETRTIIKLQICNAETGVAVFDWTLSDTDTMRKKMNETLKTGGRKTIPSDAGTVVTSGEITSSKSEPTKEEIEAKENTTEEKPSLASLINNVGNCLKSMKKEKGNLDEYAAIVYKITGANTFRCNAATEDQYDIVANIYSELKELGY